MLDGKSIAVLAGEQIEDCTVEIIEIIRAMKSVNARVRVVSSPKIHYIRGKSSTIRVDIAIDKARPEDFDAIILCTDCRSSDSRAHLHCIRFLRDAYAQGKLIAAISKGVGLISMADLLPEGILLSPAVTDSDNLETSISRADSPVIREANLIIAPVSIRLMSFVNEIISALRQEITLV